MRAWAAAPVDESGLAGQRLAVLEMVWGDNAGDGRLHVLGVADREFGRALFLLGYEQQRHADGGERVVAAPHVAP